MNFLIITLSLVGLGAAAQQPSEAAALILKQDSQVFFDGSYHSSFETENGIFAEEEGNLKNTGKADAEAGEVRGFFQYTAPDGSLVRVEYTADENGFSPKGSHLPTPPSIPPEILRAQQYIAAQGQTEQELPYRRYGANIRVFAICIGSCVFYLNPKTTYSYRNTKSASTSDRCIEHLRVMQSSALPGCDNGPIDYNKIEKHMSQFGGGKITMSKTYWDEGIAIIELNNPQKKNAISGKMMVELRNIIKELEDWGDGKALIVHGIGTNFCSGADLDFARACSTPQDGFYLSSLMMDTLFKLRKLPLVSVTLAHGATIGGGAEIAIQSDFVLACEDIKLGFVQGHMGITTAWGGATRLVQLVGEKRALDLLLSSKILDAQACVEGGLVKKIVSSSGGLNETLLWTKERIKHHRSVVRAYKSIIATASCCNYEESLVYERRVFCPLWGAPPNKEALHKHIKHIRN